LHSRRGGFAQPLRRPYQEQGAYRLRTLDVFTLKSVLFTLKSVLAASSPCKAKHPRTFSVTTIIDHAELYLREASQVRLAVQRMRRVVRLVTRKPMLGEPVGQPPYNTLLNNDNGGPGGSAIFLYFQLDAGPNPFQPTHCFCNKTLATPQTYEVATWSRRPGDEDPDSLA
jgi:hypothetical protein